MSINLQMPYLAMIPRQPEPLANNAITMCSTVIVLMPDLLDSCISEQRLSSSS